MKTETITQHTPGPWALYRGASDKLLYVVAPHSQNKIICTPAIVTNSIAREERMEANARLIAAAPDLLAALKALAPILENDGPLVATYHDEAEQVRQALAKAEGQA